MLRRLAVVASLLLMAVMAWPGPVGAASGSWPTYHGDNTRRGVDPESGLLPSTKAWTSAALDGLVYGQPTFVGGRIVVATENDSLYGLDPHTGALRRLVSWAQLPPPPPGEDVVVCTDGDGLWIQHARLGPLVRVDLDGTNVPVTLSSGGGLVNAARSGVTLSFSSVSSIAVEPWRVCTQPTTIVITTTGRFARLLRTDETVAAPVTPRHS